MINDLSTTSLVDTLSDAVDNAGQSHTPDDLITLLCRSLAVLWKDWPKQMKLTELEAPSGKFSLSGTCPHCQQGTVFIQVTNVFQDKVGQWEYRLAVGMQCQGCLDCVLAIALKTAHPNHTTKLTYLAHYPVGKPNDSVDTNVPEDIAEDFAEAMRCLWIKSYKAAVAMCRRSVEAACHDLGATGGNLYQKIENLASKGVITDPMRRMAHRVRLTGNENLHGKDKASESQFDADDLAGMKERDAIAMITFTKEFFHHVYAIQALLKQYENPEGETPADAP